MPFNVQPPYNITIVNDVFASRAIGGLYTNSTSKTMFVSVSVRAKVTLAAGYALAYAKEGGVTVAASGFDPSPVAISQTYFMMSWAVRPGKTYQLTNFSSDGEVVLAAWIESY